MACYVKKPAKVFSHTKKGTSSPGAIKAIAFGTYLAIIATNSPYLAAQNSLATPDLANFS
jgi:hypothetical protein